MVGRWPSKALAALAVVAAQIARCVGADRRSRGGRGGVRWQCYADGIRRQRRREAAVRGVSQSRGRRSRARPSVLWRLVAGGMPWVRVWSERAPSWIVPPTADHSSAALPSIAATRPRPRASRTERGRSRVPEGADCAEGAREEFGHCGDDQAGFLGGGIQRRDVLPLIPRPGAPAVSAVPCRSMETHEDRTHPMCLGRLRESACPWCWEGARVGWTLAPAACPHG